MRVADKLSVDLGLTVNKAAATGAIMFPSQVSQSFSSWKSHHIHSGDAAISQLPKLCKK